MTKIIDPDNNIWELKYDIMGNAIEMIYPDGSKIKHGFDIAGRLKIFTNKRNQSIQYSYDADTYNDLNAAYQPIRRYVYGAGKDDVEGYVEFSEVDGFVFDPSKKGWYTYVKDQVGTVYKVYSDYTKQIVDTRTYDTFGNLISQTGSSNGNLGFQSKYYDQESGMYYFYHRYYNTVNGRFLNEDPIGLDGGLNMYGFVYNNPLKWIDPYGLDFTDDHPGWMKLFCLLWKNAPKYGGDEIGSWLYHNDTGDPENRWWKTSNDPSKKYSCGPRFFPHKSVIAGSCHTHPLKRSKKATRGKDTDFAKEYHPEGKMYIISEHGIWSYDPITGEDEEVLTLKQFKNWCKCHGYW